MSDDTPENHPAGPPADFDPPIRPIDPEKVVVLGQPGSVAGEGGGSGRHYPVPRKRRALVLFLLTCLSTFFVQFRSPDDPQRPDVDTVLGMTAREWSYSFRSGLTYSVCL